MIAQNLHFKESDQGFTLVELMVTLVVASIIIVAIYSAYIIQQRTYNTQSQVVEMQQNIRAGLEMMVGEIRIATYDPDAMAGASIIEATSSKIHFTSDLNTDGDLSDPDEDVIFCLQDPAGDADGCDVDGIANSGTGVVTRNGQAIAEGIQRIEFYYNLDDGFAKTLTPSAAQLAKIQTVQVTMLAVSSQRDPKYTNNDTYPSASTVDLVAAPWGPYDDNFRRRLLSTSVKLRNHGVN